MFEGESGWYSEQTFNDCHSTFGLDRARISTAASVTTRGTASLVALALALLDRQRDFPPKALPSPKAT
jgi:hypothetical protein